MPINTRLLWYFREVFGVIHPYTGMRTYEGMVLRGFLPVPFLEFALDTVVDLEGP
tara:strand:- start:364 stop:528 length:165 start_codon:yes stop_codon:yes gene_type:complete